MMKKVGIIVFSLFILLILIGIMSIYIEIKALLMFVSGFLLMVSYSLYKKRIGQEVVIALLISSIITSYYVYEYSSSNLFIGRINLFPLILWTTGLVALREIYLKIEVKHKWIVFSLLSIASVVLVEYIGYYLFNIRLSWDFPGFFGLGILHAPTFLQFFYLFVGPIYLLITDYLKVK
jgi:hypothetical protein